MALFDWMAANAEGQTPLWLDDANYSGQLLAQGAPPWLNASDCVAWRRKSQSLLTSDVIELPIGAVIDAFIGQNDALREAMAARPRVLYPLKTLLADSALRAHLVTLARVLRDSFTGPAFALTCPSPRRLVSRAAREVLDPGALEMTQDDVDAGSVYVADFLREFAEIAIDAVLLIESADTEPTNAEDLLLYQPVINVAAHYRWDLGLLAPQGRCPDAALSFRIAPRAAPSDETAGVIVPEDFWRSAPPPACPPRGFRYAEIPTAVNPEVVLARLAMLRR